MVLDVLGFYIFFEAILPLLFLFIGIGGNKFKFIASLYIFMFTLIGSLFLLVALLSLIKILGSTDFFSFFKKESLDQIRRIKRPAEAPECGLIADLLWSDPDPSVTGFQKSHRGVAFLFGADAVLETCAKLDIDLVARAHQVRKKIF